MSGEKHRWPWPFRLIALLLCLGIILYAGVMVFLVIREKGVASEVRETDDYDAIVVLGAQVKQDGSLSVQLTWRLDAVIGAWKKRKVPVVVCGAQGKDEPMPEAVAMKQYLVENGVDEADILTDPDSFNTRQNLENAGRLLREKPGIRKILLVTSDYHVPRAMALAGDLGYKATGLGSPCKSEYWLKNHARETLAWIKYWGVKYLHLPLE